jgi:putative ABC transport system permease protein
VGRLLLVFRLAGRDLRRRPIEAALLLLAITAATTTLTLGLVLHDAARDPYARTREATAGPDVVASVAPDDYEHQPANVAALEALADSPSVAGDAGPYPVTAAVFRARGQTATAQVEGRDQTTAAIAQPDLTQGSWVVDGGLVIEAAFADALAVRPGDRVTLNGRPFRVVGVAVSAAAAPYPGMDPPGTTDNPLQYCPLPSPSPCDDLIEAGDFTPELDAALREVDAEHPGLVWATDADARSLAPQEESLNYVLNLRLDHPDDAPAFVDAHAQTTYDTPALRSWQQIRAKVAADLGHTQQRALLIGSRLLALLAVASVAVLVGGRMADQTRRVGLLKAVGGTPGLVAAVLLAEYLAVALLAAAVGLIAGWLAAPLLTDPGAGLLGSAGAPSMTVSTVGAVICVALGVAAAATVVPAVRAARTSTVRALADSARAPRRTAWLISVSARLPVPLLLGLRVAARRPRRVVLAVFSIAITTCGIVAALAAKGQLDEDRGSAIVSDRLDQPLLVIVITLAALAAVNAIVITWTTAVESRHASALVRAVGATPRQVSVGLAAAQVVPALAGAVLGVIGGLELIDAVSSGESLNVPLWQLLAVVPATTLAVALLTTVPVRLATRRPTAEILRAELA